MLAFVLCCIQPSHLLFFLKWYSIIIYVTICWVLRHHRVSLAKDDTSAGRPVDAAPSSARRESTTSDGPRP